MKRFKLIVLILLDSKLFKYVYSLILRHLLRDKKIIFVSGMRRSGNHACIKWLINSIENQKTKLHTCKKFIHFNITPSGKTIFLNEVNEMKSLIFYHMIKEKIKYIGKCDTLVISVEDCWADYSSYKIPRYDEAIYVKRSALNMVASRVKFLLNRAKKGKSNYWDALNATVLEKMLSFNKAEYKTWEFEKWLSSNEYKEKFLKDLGLKSSHLPDVSKSGGGSSFTGVDKQPNLQNLLKRYQQIQFSEEIISYFYEEKYQKILNDEEFKYMSNNYF